jgi:hypothetical protein
LNAIKSLLVGQRIEFTTYQFDHLFEKGFEKIERNVKKPIIIDLYMDDRTFPLTSFFKPIIHKKIENNVDSWWCVQT